VWGQKPWIIQKTSHQEYVRYSSRTVIELCQVNVIKRQKEVASIISYFSHTLEFKRADFSRVELEDIISDPTNSSRSLQNSFSQSQVLISHAHAYNPQK
jgi:hypothetical protein